ncbi:MAG: carbohydrate-binding family 9-like protein [Acidobacteriota bacterium]
MQISERPNILINHVSNDFPITETGRAEWRIANSATINRYWSGAEAPASRHAAARLLWSDTSLYVRFDASQSEPLIVSETPDLSAKTLGLWDHDVCELFIAPDKNQTGKYYEFEASPAGEWVDLIVDLTSGMRRIDVEYASGMTTASSVTGEKAITAMCIPFRAFGKRPEPGEMWLGNLFRCIGRDPDRGYLAYNPTGTTVPNFHVPEKFVGFEFRK